MKKSDSFAFSRLPLGKTPAQVTVLELKTGTAVFRQGQNCKHIFSLRSGIIKLTYLTEDGREYIKSFITAGSLFGSMASHLHQEATSFSAVTITDVVVERLEFKHFRAWISSSPETMEVGLNHLMNLAYKKEKREYQFLCLPAHERYAIFLQEYAELRPHITQADIARYIGITPVALSRLKARLSSPDA